MYGLNLDVWQLPRCGCIPFSDIYKIYMFLLYIFYINLIIDIE